jgi:hypothetical protein
MRNKEQYSHTGWGDESWTEVFFSKNRPSFLIEAFGSPGKGWLLCVDLLRTDLFDIAAIFCHDGLQAAAERAAGPADVGQLHPVPLPGDGPA